MPVLHRWRLERGCPPFQQAKRCTNCGLRVRLVFVDDPKARNQRKLVKAYSMNPRAKRDKDFYIPEQPPSCGDE